jgi:ataxia telangiectasia mutated family protein
MLQDHLLLFNELLESLPKEADWMEGIAMRLYTLTILSSAWFTLLRRGIYHIFESPGFIPGCSAYAANCLRHLARSLGFTTPKELFTLFASQLLYTWLETQSLNSIPFSIFGYETLEACLFDARQEIVSQMMMRGNQKGLETLSTLLRLSLEELVLEAFSKCYSYALAGDLSASTDSGASGVNRIAKLLEKGRTEKLVTQHLPEILAISFVTIDEDANIGLSFLRQSKLAYASKAITEMRGMNADQADLYITQQPCFPAKFLVDQISQLCKISKLNLVTMWTPELYTFVARRILEKLHSALGSLHTASVLRRLRVLIALAKGTAFNDYPLRLVLHALRPFLSDIQCAEEAVGITKFLLLNGSPYLQTTPSLFSGFALTTFVSLNSLLSTSQDSNTPEEHYLSIRSTVQIFRDWFSDFVDDYHRKPPVSAESAERAEIHKAARDLRSFSDTSELDGQSVLILSLLKDLNRERGVIDRASAEASLHLLAAQYKHKADVSAETSLSTQAAATFAGALFRS